MRDGARDGDALVVPATVRALAERVAAAGGRLLVVGGWVRDALRGRRAHDLDLEVYGLSRDAIARLLDAEGFSGPVGRQFPIWRRTKDDLDVALPRLSPGLAAADFDAQVADAARGRDLTVNAIAWDPLEGALLDPLGGAADLAARRLRAADPARFGTDPIRALRVARLAVALEAEVEPALAASCRAADLGPVPVERRAAELARMLLELDRPARALEQVEALGQLETFPPLAALRGVPQDPEWHPEGDVWIHTRLVVDRAATLARTLPVDRAERLLWAALCHDVGKPAVTRRGDDGRVRSPGHDVEGERVTRDWLGALRIGTRRTEAVAGLVRHHLAPSQLVKQGSGPRAYRRLARRLAAVGVDMVELERLARADHLGRTTADAEAGRYAAGDRFLAEARRLEVAERIAEDAVDAAMLMRSGVPAGPALGRLLERCRAIQDELGPDDPEAILRRALREARSAKEPGERPGE